MKSIIQTEFRHLLTLKWVRWTFLSLLAVEIVSAIFLVKITQVQDTSHLSAFEMLGFTFRSGFYTVLFFLFGNVAISIASENNSGVLKTILSLLPNRGDYLTGKCLAHVVLGIGFTLTALVLSLILGFFSGDFSGLLEGTYIIISSGDLWKSLFLATLIIIFPLIAGISIALFFSVLCRNSGMAVILTFGFFLALSLTGFSDFTLIFDFNNKLLTHYISFPLNTFIALSKGLPSTWKPDIFYLIFGSILYGGLFFFTSLALFQRRDFS